VIWSLAFYFDELFFWEKHLIKDEINKMNDFQEESRVCNSPKCSKDSLFFFVLFFIMICICIFGLFTLFRNKS